jgi:hypothetical protein
MAQLILLIVAAAWLAVLIPPMLRSRVENRPNSSVTDFRRQLTKLQNTATPPRGAVRTFGRPLAQSPLARPAAIGRPAQPVLRSGVSRRPMNSDITAPNVRHTTMVAHGRLADPTGETGRYRTHGDPTGGQQRSARPASRRPDHTDRQPRPHTRERISRDPNVPRAHGDPTGGQRRPVDPSGELRRRRSNVLFVLAITTFSTLFLATTMKSDVMLYLFVLSFLSTCTYVWASRRERFGHGWVESY